MATATYIPRLKQRYDDELRPQLKDELGLASIMHVPRIAKITLNMGVGDAKTDAKALDAAIEELSIIAGQHAQVRRARKSIASFKLREGMAVGAKVTLRGARMYEFLDRLVSIALPRIRDFRGLNPDSFDGRGNYSLGIREQIIFPEIDYDTVETIRGLDVAITTTAKTDEQALALLRDLGLPFATETGRISKWPRSPSSSSRSATQKYKMRNYTRCNRCGRPRAVFKKFGLCRICLRELAHQGAIPGMTKIELVGATMLTDPSQTCSPASATPTRRCTTPPRCRPPG